MQCKNPRFKEVVAGIGEPQVRLALLAFPQPFQAPPNLLWGMSLTWSLPVSQKETQSPQHPPRGSSGIMRLQTHTSMLNICRHNFLGLAKVPPVFTIRTFTREL